MAYKKLIAVVTGVLATGSAGSAIVPTLTDNPAVQQDSKAVTTATEVKPAQPQEKAYTFHFGNKELKISCPLNSFPDDSTDYKSKTMYVICQLKKNGYFYYEQDKTFGWESFHGIWKPKPKCVFQADGGTYKCTDANVEIKELPRRLDGMANRTVIQVN
ncbi:hypothetical protein MHLP_01155 [Candidatus Mycoplasma haematolamae str. Purdue]|uniref:Uncharacterized protein n=1 Tax=Mycoplasma haematolamae (strain Purdue) TaxID=1212765 RepID=I7CEX1_MYCHA|nr:hypothetical protein [Candidatus Mycoplasma haematolamae]AFO51811.1 hypothetical protein MHLP_01155 [Candidatus Mycoplasma haematolamae str. Purdue]